MLKIKLAIYTTIILLKKYTDLKIEYSSSYQF